MTWRKHTLLLTGGSGVLGRALIDELSGEYDIVCQRNRQAIADPRVSEFAGDFEHPTLGLSASDYRRLVDRVDVIVHSAAMTNWKADPERIHATNIGGTTAMLRLAEESGAPLYFVSTAFVANPPDDHAFAGASSYVRSKIDAEQMVREHAATAVIVRPSVVTGHSEDGRIAAFQGLHGLLGSVVRGHVPMVPCGEDAMIDIIPQDVVTGALARLLREEVTEGEFWLTAGPQALRALDLLDICLEVVAEIGSTPIVPRLVPSDTVDRLILPLLEETLPRRLQRMFRDLLEFTWLFQTDEPLPTSLPELGFADAVTHRALRAATKNSLRYWAKTKRLLPEHDRVQVA